jgi:hypothetical protein
MLNTEAHLPAVPSERCNELGPVDMLRVPNDAWAGKLGRIREFAPDFGNQQPFPGHRREEIGNLTGGSRRRFAAGTPSPQPSGPETER